MNTQHFVYYNYKPHIAYLCHEIVGKVVKSFKQDVLSVRHDLPSRVPDDDAVRQSAA